MQDRYTSPYLHPSKYEWRIAGILFVSYLLISVGTAQFIAPSLEINLAYGVALGVLFFAGLRLWPVVYATGLASAVLVQVPDISLVVSPLAATAQIVAGAYLLRQWNIDPLFRRNHDMFYFVAAIGSISFIHPALLFLASSFVAAPEPLSTGIHVYVATVFSFLVTTPFVLRWFAKPRFSRTAREAVETSVAFLGLTGVNWLLFVAKIQTIAGIPLLYLLPVPLFFIALRLRPRFLTLALMMTSFFAIGGVLTDGDTVSLAERLFQTELFMIALSISFYIIVSLAEDKRVNTNLMHSQLATLKNAVARVSSESSAKNDFIAILAHELRNPLAPVVSAIELLQLKGARDADEAGMLEVMASRMEIVRRLLDNLLDVSRISEGKVTSKKERVDLQSAIKGAILSTDHHRKERHQQLILKMPSDALYLEGDRVQIEQVFSNLLTNASKYSDPGDSITLLMQKEGGVVMVEVADNGVGLDRHAIENIFLPFHQVEQGERSKRGLGIGLALVRDFVHMHGGTVTAQSDGLGKGSRFIVLLPLLPPEKLETLASEESNQTESAEKSGLLVLVVDDNDAAAGAIGRLLELQGYKVAYAYDGRQALHKAYILSPDAILLDIGLPDQDGYEVGKVMRERGFKGRLIALTGYSIDEARERAKHSGFDYFLVKPAGLAELKRVLPEL